MLKTILTGSAIILVLIMTVFFFIAAVAGDNPDARAIAQLFYIPAIAFGLLGMIVIFVAERVR